MKAARQTMTLSLGPAVAGLAVMIQIAGAGDVRAAVRSGERLGTDSSTTTPPIAQRVRRVRCHRGESLGAALERARPGDLVAVRGTCSERVTISTDGITLKGLEDGVLDGGGGPPSEFDAVITVDGARDVTLAGLVVQNGSGEGILVQRNASVTLQNVAVRGNANVGLLSDHSRVEVEDSELTHNLSGMDTTNGSSTVFRGQVSLRDNAAFGLAASNGASMEIRGGTVDASRNGQIGILLEGGDLAIFNYFVSQGSQILADDNGAVGMVLVGGGRLDIIAPPPFHFTGSNLVSASRNAGIGIALYNGASIESPFGAATFRLEDNQVGMEIAGGSRTLINGGLQIHDNVQVGVLADGAGMVSFAPGLGLPALLASEVTGNGTDVVLQFGSRAEFAATVGSLVCDPTAMARGTATCP